jgi:hypothetical protein
LNTRNNKALPLDLAYLERLSVRSLADLPYEGKVICYLPWLQLQSSDHLQKQIKKEKFIEFYIKEN